MRFQISYSCISNIGLCRGINQDNFICAGVYNAQYFVSEGTALPKFPLTGVVTNTQNALFGIFDGMGGEARGEAASYLAAKAASEAQLDNAADEVLNQICFAANQAICAFTNENRLSTCGTTAAMLFFDASKITSCNVGDSKIFRLSDGELRQISQDHVAPAPFGGKPPLSQYLGIPPEEMYIVPFLTEQNYHTGDSYLICSDGLTDMVSIEQIRQFLMVPETNTAAQELLNLALKNGGKDNITLIVLRIEKAETKLKSFLKKLL